MNFLLQLSELVDVSKLEADNFCISPHYMNGKTLHQMRNTWVDLPRSL